MGEEQLHLVPLHFHLPEGRTVGGNAPITIGLVQGQIRQPVADLPLLARMNLRALVVIQESLFPTGSRGSAVAAPCCHSVV